MNAYGKKLSAAAGLWMMLAALAVSTGCAGEVIFQPYDYHRAEDARLKVRSGYSLRIHGGRLILERKVYFP